MIFKENGYALFFVLIILTVFTLLFPAVLRLTITEFVIANNYQKNIEDYYLIEGAINLGVSEVYNDLKKLEYISDEGLQLPYNEGSLEITDSNNNKLIIKYKVLSIIDESSKININTASKEMLKSLFGIGDDIAEGIIDKREFNAIEELSQISGIGKIDNEDNYESKTYQDIKDDITIRSDGRININTASSSVLKSLNEIGNTLSDNIKASRPFANKDEVKKVEGIGDIIYSKLEDKIKVTSHNFKVRLEVSIEDRGIKKKIERFIELD